MPGPVPRSYLFVPGDRPERFAKAMSAGADAVILDLEDAVAIAGKKAAREAVAAALDPARPAWVRVNARETAWFEEDLRAIARPGLAGVMLPKAERPEDALRVEAVTGAKVLALIESAVGLWNALEVGRCPAVARIAFGSIDYQVDLNLDGEDEPLLHARAQLALASRVAGLPPPVDGVSVAIDDAGAIEADALRGRRLGFGGKLCIHPKQVEVVNRCFSPTPAELDWARRVVAAIDASGGAAVAVDGKMVDKPVLMKAQRILGAG